MVVGSVTTRFSQGLSQRLSQGLLWLSRGLSRGLFEGCFRVIITESLQTLSGEPLDTDSQALGTHRTSLNPGGSGDDVASIPIRIQGYQDYQGYQGHYIGL